MLTSPSRCLRLSLVSLSHTFLFFIVICVLTGFVWMYSVKDAMTTWKETNTKHIFSWQTLQDSFKRSVLPIGLHTVVIGPLLCTFVMQSRGEMFFDFLQRGGDTEDLMLTYIITSVLFLVVSGLMVFICRAVLDHGLFKKEGSTAHSKVTCLKKTTGLALLSLVILFNYCNFAANFAATEANSGRYLEGFY